MPVRHDVTGEYYMDLCIPPAQVPMPPPMDASGKVLAPRTATRDSGNTGQVDVSFTDPTTVGLRFEASKCPGHAAKVRSQRKFDTYAPVMAPTNTLIPSVVEQYGRLSPHAHALLAVLARAASERTSGSRRTSNYLSLIHI